jgi:PAS domain S-box-containing protein
MNQSLQSSQLFLERITDAMLALDKNFCFTYLNSKASQYFNKPVNELLGKNIWIEFPEELESKFCKACNEAMQKFQFISIEIFHHKYNRLFEFLIYPGDTGLSIIIKKVRKQDLLQNELRNAEEEIKKSSERFDLVTLATNDMIWDWDFVSNEVWWNSNFNNFFGYSKDMGHHHISSWINSIHEEDRKRVVDSIYGVINSGKKFWTDEYRYLKRDGTILNIYDRGYVSHDGSGKPYRMIGSMLNITDRIKAEQAIKKSEEKYRTLVEQASDAVYITDKAGTIHTVNVSACRMTGYAEAELLQMNIYGFVFPEDIVERPFRFDELEVEKTISIERRFKVRDGKELNLDISANMLSDGRVLVFARDISERLKVQNEIIKEKNYSDSIINSLPGIFYMHDIEGKILRWNKNFEAITGYGSEEIKTMYPLDFYIEAERGFMKKTAIDVYNNETTQVEANFLAKNKKQIPFQIIGTKIISEGQPCIIVVGIDITEKRKSEALLIKSYDDVRRLASHVTNVREEERRRIGREIHDELGQQLTAIKMDVSWMDKKITDDTNPLKNNIKNILEILNGTNQSVRRILHELSPGVIDNKGLIEALQILNHQFVTSTNIVLDFKTTESEIELKQEISNCIFRVYQESLTNIMRYAEASKVNTALWLTDNAINVSIEDNGKGFDMNTVQSKKSFGILGMKERVLSQNGTFELHSNSGNGTHIVFYIPISF